MTISVALGTYNGARFLREQLDSIAAQTRLPDEVVVCDDHSSDSTGDIVTAFAASAGFPVHLHVNDQNLGSVRNFERAIRFCEGDIIALADQDDVWLPGKLQRIEEVFLHDPGVGLVFTDAEVVDEHLRPLGFRLWASVGFDANHQRLVRTGRALDVLLPGWTVTGATMAFRARFRDLVLDLPTNLRLLHDGWIALMIASVADVSFLDEPLIQYRQHAAQQVGAGAPGKRVATQRVESYERLIDNGTEAHRRLLERSDVFETAAARARLADRLTHLRTRSKLPAAALTRCAGVIREVLSGRYHRYSNGLSSAARDLLRK